MKQASSSSKFRKAAGSILGTVAGLICWGIIFQPQLPPPSKVAEQPSWPLACAGSAIRVELRSCLPTPSASASEAVKQGRFIMEITHPDERRLLSILMKRGGLVVAEHQGQLYLLTPAGRVLAGHAGVAWKDYSLPRVWRIAASDSVVGLGLPVLPGDRLCVAMPIGWEMALAGALETALPEPVTAYRKARLQAMETPGGHLNLVLLSADHRERGTQTFNHVIRGI